MSIGFGGYADLVDADNSKVTYKYCCYNANSEDYKIFMTIEDGELVMSRNAFIEPELHERIKKMPSGKKRLVHKRVIQVVPIEEYVDTGVIQITNASGTWRTTELGIDFMAFKILYKLFNEYQTAGELPAHISLFY